MASRFSSLAVAPRKAAAIYEEELTQKLRDNRRQELEPSQPIFRIIGDAPPTAPRSVERRFTDSEANSMRNSQRRRFNDDDDFETIIGYDGKPVRILKDGRSVHVSLEIRDSLRRDDEAKRIAAIAVTESVMRGSGTAADPYILGQWPTTDACAANKPGYRYADASSTYQTEDPGPGLGAGDDPFDRPRRRRRRAQMRDPMGREAGTISEEENDSLAGLSPSERARAERALENSQAWRTDARALQATPAPGGYYPTTAGVGAACMLNGEAGVLQPDPDGSGFLVCKVVNRVGPTRSGTSAGDSVNDARTEAWKEMCEYTFNAWRT
jgi:hypothetical protein